MTQVCLPQEHALSKGNFTRFEQVLEEDPEYPKICEQLAAVCLVLQDHEGFKKYNAMSGDSINLDSLRDTILEMGVDGEQMLRELDDFLKDEK